ncbi:hypothetical protein, partial [Pseudomonas sp. 5RIF]|uniref:hypothetical protein n=1 Tax=Pseudomonas sp. 5RIF TaxID=3093714 RepID=UPI0030E9640C
RLGVARILRTALYPGKHFFNFFQKKPQAFQRPSVATRIFTSSNRYWHSDRVGLRAPLGE